MRTEIHSNHFTDASGTPCGGTTYGQGFAIAWQNGPLVKDGERIPANGAFVEDVLAAALDRIDYYQDTRFNCMENEEAMRYIRAALDALDARTKRRQAANTEGTHKGA